MFIVAENTNFCQFITDKIKLFSRLLWFQSTYILWTYSELDVKALL